MSFTRLGAADLAGRRVGIPEWAQTAGIYARAYLQHQSGVPLRDFHWVQAGVNQAGRIEKVMLSLPEGVRVEHIHHSVAEARALFGEDFVLMGIEPNRRSTLAACFPVLSRTGCHESRSADRGAFSTRA